MALFSIWQYNCDRQKWITISSQFQTPNFFWFPCPLTTTVNYYLPISIVNSPWHLNLLLSLNSLLRNPIQTIVCGSLQRQREVLERLILMEAVVWSKTPLWLWTFAIWFRGTIWRKMKLYVSIETTSNYSSSNAYHSSKLLNGPGTWKLVLWIWTRVTMSF